MARSRRAPFFTSTGSGYRRFFKRLAAKRVRQFRDVVCGGMFRRVSCSYDINDYGWYAGNNDKVRRK